MSLAYFQVKCTACMHEWQAADMEKGRWWDKEYDPNICDWCGAKGEVIG